MVSSSSSGAGWPCSNALGVALPGWIDARGEPIRNPVTGEEHRARINLPHGFEYDTCEIGRGWEGPVFADVYVEHKDLFGLTVRATVGNILNARHRFEREVYDGRRERDPIAFIQKNNQLIGPIFRLSVKGTF